MIVVARDAYADALRHAEAERPGEALGVWFGRRQGDELLLTRFRALRNAAADASAGFIASPPEWLAALREAARGGEIVAGLLHSHPDGPLGPSPADLATMWHTIPTHWIVYWPGGERPEAFAYRLSPPESGGALASAEPLSYRLSAL